MLRLMVCIRLLLVGPLWRVVSCVAPASPPLPSHPRTPRHAPPPPKSASRGRDGAPHHRSVGQRSPSFSNLGDRSLSLLGGGPCRTVVGVRRPVRVRGATGRLHRPLDGSPRARPGNGDRASRVR